jgi:hypothetical protein
MEKSPFKAFLKKEIFIWLPKGIGDGAVNVRDYFLPGAALI